MAELNLYGDTRNPTKGEYGVDIAAQRADDLDNMAILRLAYQNGLTRKPRALDAGGAAGGQGIRMAEAGATVVCLDISDYEAPFMAAAKTSGVAKDCSFFQCDLRGYPVVEHHKPFDVIVCQRMIHYVPFHDAVAIVKEFRRAMTPAGRLYISASGMGSELGDNYPGKDVPLASRYAPLADTMADKHAIRGPVCLYSQDDMAELLVAAGLTVENVFASAFGNIKAVAK